jgi:homoserine O-succinyltransferase/O-acetyltransferase
MSILFEKHPLTVSLALAPGKPREADELDRSQNAADAVLTIGLINNMPDSALQATERQFIRLLEAAAGNIVSCCIASHCHPSNDRSRRSRGSTGDTLTSPISIT